MKLLLTFQALLTPVTLAAFKTIFPCEKIFSPFPNAFVKKEDKSTHSCIADNLKSKYVFSNSSDGQCYFLEDDWTEIAEKSEGEELGCTFASSKYLNMFKKNSGFLRISLDYMTVSNKTYFWGVSSPEDCLNGCKEHGVEVIQGAVALANYGKFGRCYCLTKLVMRASSSNSWSNYELYFNPEILGEKKTATTSSWDYSKDSDVFAHTTCAFYLYSLYSKCSPKKNVADTKCKWNDTKVKNSEESGLCTAMCCEVQVNLSTCATHRDQNSNDCPTLKDGNEKTECNNPEECQAECCEAETTPSTCGDHRDQNSNECPTLKDRIKDHTECNNPEECQAECCEAETTPSTCGDHRKNSNECPTLKDRTNDNTECKTEECQAECCEVTPNKNKTNEINKPNITTTTNTTSRGSIANTTSRGSIALTFMLAVLRLC